MEIGSLSLFMDCSHNGGSANDTVIKCACGGVLSERLLIHHCDIFLDLMSPFTSAIHMFTLCYLDTNMKRAKNLRIFLFSWDPMYSLAI